MIKTNNGMTKEEFLKGVQNWNNHLHLLWPALEGTKGDIVEMGMGPGSTPILHQYAKENNRKLFSYESDLDWFHKFSDMDCHFHKLEYVSDWDAVNMKHATVDVLFVDHAPGERRRIDLQLFARKAGLIVVHDTEPAADHGYQMIPILRTFKYWHNYESEGAWASIVSNSWEHNHVIRKLIEEAGK